MKKGFTLAEVLITLAIIGVVAALTIPVVVHKYQQKAYYTQFMKSYNTLSNTINLSTAENGFPKAWTVEGDNWKGAIEKYLLPYLNIASKCSASDSECANYSFTAVTGDDLGLTLGQFLNLMANSIDLDIYTLADGSNFAFGLGFNSSNELVTVTTIFDTNGAKGPNVFGRDIFYIEYAYFETGNISEKHLNRWRWRNQYQEAKDEHNIDACDPNGSAMIDSAPNGAFCAGKLLAEGKMNY